jgi:glycosyltransferase involved in cell wall biosynthesis
LNMISDDILSTEYLGQNKVVNSIQPLVSVCVVTYNHAPYIEECLDSILNQQTDFPFEIIIGEDNSTDGTREICKRYAENHPDKIRLFLRRPDQKIPVNGKKTFHFNFYEGLKAARGEFIALCDGDDYWLLKDKLTRQVQVLSNDSSLAICISGWNSEVKSYSTEQKVVVHRVVKKSGEFEKTLGHTSSILFKKSCFSIKPYLYKMVVGDRHLVNIIMDFGDCAVLKPALSYYRRHDGGIFRGIANKERLSAYFFDLNVLREEGLISRPYYWEKKVEIQKESFPYNVLNKLIRLKKSSKKKFKLLLRK